MDYRSALALLAVGVLLLRFFIKHFFSVRRHSGLPFPPGPTPRPIIGNLHDLPTRHPWLTYTDWGLRYGDLMHASVFGQHVIIINSVKTATELFEKRSHIYSDRPVVPIVKLLGWDYNTALLPIGDRWRRHRRILQQHFRRDISRQYHPIQMKKVHDLLHGLLSNPEDFRELIQTLAAAIIMSAVYGYEVEPSNDRFVTICDAAVRKLADSFFPGAVAVNVIPILRHLPSWMPGAGFQRFAAECRELNQEMKKGPFEFTKQNMRDGAEANSVVAKLLESSGRQSHSEETIQETAATAYAAGAETTVSSIASFFLTMALHPDIQKRAQDEIDAVVGTHRLPGFEDRASLPFVEALYREVMRWKPGIPLGVPHSTSAEDIYNGCFIPKGAIVVSNIWAMTRDESIYSEPNRFNPDRFFTADGKLNDDDTVLAFGFGRRICVGRWYGDASVWATIVSVLAAFDIAKGKDAAGNEIGIDPDNYGGGLVSHPEPFACSITPRSEAAKNLVQAAVENQDV
ncbi:cytochrome P450 [Mycena olivaceomarginata]|nr:cytochrome P450 [Mycena olivaceomarginata]